MNEKQRASNGHDMANDSVVEAQRKQRASSLRSRFAVPPWVMQNLRDKDSWKVTIRCAVAFAAGFILILPSPSLAVLGNAAFFSSIVLIMVPPAFPVQMYLFATSTLMIGALLGWAWGSAAMAAALRARSQTLLTQQIQRESASVAGQSNPDVLYQTDLFHGVFLDPRSSAVFGAFLASGTFFAAYVKVRAPRLTLASIFITIFLDVTCSYGPLFPAPNYLIMQTFLVSAACGIAIGVASCILIFPTSMSYLFSKSWIKTLSTVQGVLDVQLAMIETDVHDHEAWAKYLPQLTQNRAQLVGLLADLDSKVGMLELEVSHGRFAASDLKELSRGVRMFTLRTSGLRAFPEVMWRRGTELTARHDEKEKDETGRPASRVIDSLLTLASAQAQHQRLEEEHGHRLEDLFPLVRGAVRPLLLACHDALQGCIDAHTLINTRRWRSPDLSMLEGEEARLASLRKALHEFNTVGRLRVLEPFRSHFDANGNSRIPFGDSTMPFSIRSLFALLSLQTSIVAFAEEADLFLELSTKLQKERQTNRFWAPTGLRKIAHIVLDRKHDSSLPPTMQPSDVDGSDDAANNDPNDELAMEKEEARVGLRFERRDPDARAPRGSLQRFGRGIRNLYAWLGSAEGLFCLKYSVVSVALWMPSVFESTAYFNYGQKVLWAQIMAQTGLGIYVSDQLSTYAFRFGGTIVGGGVGMVLWYISTGSGNGNPYGLGAVICVVAIPFAFLRAHAPPQQLILIMLSLITTILVVGYSWVNTHLAVLANLGWGWSIAWRRTLLVAVGMSAAAIMMLLPPQSGHTLVRKSASRCLGEIMDLYALLIEGWIDDEANHHSQGSAYAKVFRERFIAANQHVTALQMATRTARYEINLRGPWPADEYSRLCDMQVALLQSLLQLGAALHRLDNDWRRRVVQRTAFLNPLLVAEVMSVGTVAATSLMTAQPISSAVPRQLIDRVLFFASSQRLHTRHRDDDEHLTWSTMQNAELATFASALLASLSFLSRLDEAHEVVRNLVGTVEMDGLAKRMQRYNEVREHQD